MTMIIKINSLIASFQVIYTECLIYVSHQNAFLSWFIFWRKFKSCLSNDIQKVFLEWASIIDIKKFKTEAKLEWSIIKEHVTASYISSLYRKHEKKKIFHIADSVHRCDVNFQDDADNDDSKIWYSYRLWVKSSSF